MGVPFQVAAVVALNFLFCSSVHARQVQQQATPLRRYQLPGAGGSGPFEVVTDLTSAFEAKFPEADLRISSVGTGASQAALWGDLDCENKWIDGVCPSSSESESAAQDPSDLNLLQETVFGIGGAPLDQDDIDDHWDLDLQHLPAFANPVLVVYSKDVTGELGRKTSKQLNMSYATIAAIFQGTISSWDHPSLQAQNPGLDLPNERITVFVRADKSGMSKTFTEFLQHTNADTWPEEAVGSKPQWPLSNITDLSDTSAATQVSPLHWKADGQTGIGIGLLRRPFSIGYLELGYFSTLTQFVAQAYVSGPKNPTDYRPATVETVRAAMDGLSDKLDPHDLSLNMVQHDTPVGGFPISRYLYWFVKKNHRNYQGCYQAWLIFTFLQWAYTDPLASEIALGHGMIIPPASVVSKAVDALDQIQCRVANGEEQQQEDGAAFKVGDIIPAASFVPPPYREPPSNYDDDPITLVVAVSVCVCVLLFVMFGIYHLVQREKERKKVDTVWMVKPSELKYGSPPEVIGQGTFGTVLLANYRGTDVAVKRVLPPRTNGQGSGGSLIDLESGPSSSDAFASFNSSLVPSNSSRILANATTYSMLKDSFITEMRTLSRLRHPSITIIMGAVMDDPPIIVMEYCLHGSLHDVLRNASASLEGDLILPILRDVSSGVLFLHSATPQCIHADLKSQNVLVDSKFRAKVADFGLSAKKSLGARGTPIFMSPELLRGEPNTAASDVYALGCIFCEIYSRKEPYEEEEDLRLVLKEVADPSINKRPVIPASCPPEMVSLMKDCWQSDPSKRPLMEEIDNRLKRLDASNAEPGDLIRRNKASKELVYNIFPKHIADALRDGRKVEPEHHDCVTIFFSDVVGFTTISSQVSPAKVSDMLDRLYARFDELSLKHHVFKLEVVGDAYLGVTNLVSKQESDHTKRMIDFSMEAIQAASETLIDLENPEMGCIRIRTGIHSGPVIASVVGNRLPKFSLFGDAMNTASRMESTSAAGRIHCSNETADLLIRQAPDQYMLMPRDIIDVKGKGQMQTYWVEKGSRHDGCDRVKQEDHDGHNGSTVGSSETGKTTQADDCSLSTADTNNWVEV